jgi:hypothetical protein
MLLIRKTSFVALVLTFVGTLPLLRAPVPATHATVGPPPATRVAILTKRSRVRRPTGFASLRMIAPRSLRRLRWVPIAIEARRQSLRSRPSLRDTYARGPP